MYKHLPHTIEKNWLFRKLFLLRKVYLIKSFFLYNSQSGVDIAVKRLFPKDYKGVFVDVGCFHPVKYNNTYSLYKRGWRGVNIDLDAIKIEAFNMKRPHDVNVVTAVSDREEEVEYYSFGFYALTNSLSQEFVEENIPGTHANLRMKKVRTRTLESVLSETQYAESEIDVLSLDVEGNEVKVLRSLDFEVHRPRIIIAEIKKELLEEVMDEELFVYLKDKGYSLINWVGSDLVFQRKA